MAMAAVGCTSCRECNTGTCHVGITAHFLTPEEAAAGGAKKYVPRDYDRSVDGLVTFGHVINEIGLWTMRLGFNRTQDLVGRSDLLKQSRGNDSIDLSYLLSGVDGSETYEPEALRTILVAHTDLAPPSARLVTDKIWRLIEGGKSVSIYEDDKVSYLTAHLVLTSPDCSPGPNRPGSCRTILAGDPQL
jgi:glutamate synthase (NADPH/NADH) large chain